VAKHKPPRRAAPAPLPPRAKPAVPAPIPPRVSPLTVRPTTQFERDVNRMKKRGKEIDKLYAVIRTLAQGNPLEPKHRDHALSGELKELRECHIEPNWLLTYRQQAGELILFRTGSHPDLFN